MTLQRGQGRSPGILLSPCDVGGEASGLAAALARAGFEPTLALARPDPWRTPACPPRTFRSECTRRLFALGAPLRFDILHFFFGRTLLHPEESCTDRPPFHADLRLARLLGRKIFMTLQGCDARDPSFTPDEASPCRAGGCRHSEACRARRDARRRALHETLLPLCAAVFCLNPDLVPHAGPRARFLPYAGVDVGRIDPAPPRKAAGPIRILHAPTDRGIKGSALIEEALAHLASARALSLTVAEGRPRDEVLDRIREADLVIDQVRVGWYGSFAVEAMAVGRPVACYVREKDLAFVPPEMAASLPVLRLRPASLEEDLATALERHADYPALGEAARAFARAWHDPGRVAAEVVREYLK